MSLTGIINTHTMAATLVMRHGTDEQKARWLPSMAAGDRRGAMSLSEPDAGSDTRNISCKAVRDGDEYVVDGTKAWVTNGETSSLVALVARTEEGISNFVVEKEPGPTFEGITVASHVGKLGYRGVETVEMSYVDHRVPAANLVGEPGRGLPQILGVLEIGRINIASRAVGVARAAFDAALAYAQQRETFGKPIAEHQAIQLKLADMATQARGGPPADPQRRRAQGGGAPLRRRGRHGEAVRQRDRAWSSRPSRCASTAASATPPTCRSSATTATRRS